MTRLSKKAPAKYLESLENSWTAPRISLQNMNSHLSTWEGPVVQVCPGDSELLERPCLQWEKVMTLILCNTSISMVIMNYSWAYEAKSEMKGQAPQ